MQATKALTSLNISKGLTEPLLLDSAIEPKTRILAHISNLHTNNYHSNPICCCMYICFACHFEIEK